MSIMTSTSSVYTFPIHNRLQTKNTHKLHSSPSSWLCYGEVFKESRGLFTLCGDFQMGIINIRLHISQYHIGTPQLALKLFTSCLISPAYNCSTFRFQCFQTRNQSPWNDLTSKYNVSNCKDIISIQLFFFRESLRCTGNEAKVSSVWSLTINLFFFFEKI